MKKMEKKGEWLSLQEALTFCEAHGRIITQNGLIYSGKELNFVRKNVDGYHWEYEKRGLLMYLRTAFVPDGWISVEKFAFKVNDNVNTVYYILRKYHLKHKKYGSLKGIIHVKERTAFAAYRKYKGIDNVREEKAPSLF